MPFGTQHFKQHCWIFSVNEAKTISNQTVEGQSDKVVWDDVHGHVEETFVEEEDRESSGGALH